MRRRFQKKSKDKKRNTKKPVRRFLDTLALCCGKCCQPKTMDDTEDEEGVVDKVSPTKTLPDLLSTQEEDSRAGLQEELEKEDESAAAPARPERVTTMDDECETVSLVSTENSIDSPALCQRVETSLDVAKEVRKTDKFHVSKYNSTFDLLPKNVALFVDFYGKAEDKWLDGNTEVAETERHSNDACFASKSDLMAKNVALFVDFFGVASDEKHSTQLEKSESAINKFSKAEAVKASSREEDSLNPQKPSSMVKARKEFSRSNSEVLPKNLAQFVDFCDKFTDVVENSEEDMDHKKKLELCTSLSHLLPRSVVEFVGMARDNLNAAEQEVSFENVDIVEFSTERSIQKDLSGVETVEEDFCSMDDDETEVGSGLEDSETDVQIQYQNKDASVGETAEKVACKEFDKGGQKAERVKSEGEARTEASSVAKQNCKGKKNRKKKQRKKRSNKKRKGKKGGK